MFNGSRVSQGIPFIPSFRVRVVVKGMADSLESYSELRQQQHSRNWRKWAETPFSQTTVIRNNDAEVVYHDLAL